MASSVSHHMIHISGVTANATKSSGWANNRLIDGTDVALQHNLGLGGAVVVTVYKRADGKVAKAVSNEEIGKHNKLGYNPAVEAKGFTKAQVDQARSKKMRSEWVCLFSLFF